MGIVLTKIEMMENGAVVHLTTPYLSKFEKDRTPGKRCPIHAGVEEFYRIGKPTTVNSRAGEGTPGVKSPKRALTA